MGILQRGCGLMKQKAFFKYKISKILDEIILIIVAIMFLFPLLWMFCASFYDTTQASQYPPRLFPDPISLRSYLYVFSDKRIPRYFLNTFLITVICVVGTLITASLTAFGFAKLKSRFKNILFFILLSTMMIPSSVTLLPTYTIFSKFGLVNTYWPLIIPSLFGGGAFYIFLLRQFLRQFRMSCQRLQL